MKLLRGNRKKSVVGFLVVFFITVLIADRAVAYLITGVTHDLATTSSYNVRLDGGTNDKWIGDQTLTSGDLDNDGKPDLVLGADFSNNQSRAASGSLYILYNTLLSGFTGTANNRDLATSTNYNVRIDGAGAADILAFRQSSIGDVDGDGKNDLAIPVRQTDNNSRTNSGSVYIITYTILHSLSGTGNILDLSNPANYFLRYDGPSGNAQLGGGPAVITDIDGNGQKDLLMAANGASNNSRTSSGSVYLIRSSLLRSYSGTGNTIDLATSTNYNLRYDGPIASLALGDMALSSGDLNGNGINDILIGAYNDGQNGRGTSGSAYVIYDSLPALYSGTGNNIDLATNTNYNIRYEGGSATEFLSTNSMIVTDVNSDGSNDLVFGANGADYNGRTGSGSFYIIYHSLISPLTGTGNTVDLANGNNYNMRFDGPAAGSNIARLGMNVADVDNDGKIDIILPSYSDYNSRTDSGALFLITNDIISSYTGTGNNVDMNTAGTWSFRYDGAATADAYTEASAMAVDFDQDGSNDLVSGAYLADNNSRTDSGSAYIVYGFPHTINMNNDGTVSGTVTASQSTTAIANIQVSTGSTFASSWSNCTASDGAFDSTTESFSCTNSSTGTYYVRARDTNGIYTPVSRYASVTLGGGSTPSTSPTPSSSAATSDSNTPVHLTVSAQRYSNNGVVAVTGTYTGSPKQITIRGINGRSENALLNNGTFIDTLTNVPQGNYEFSAIADGDDRTNSIANQLTTVDTTAPFIRPVYSAILTNQGSIRINGQVTDGGYSTLDKLTLTNSGTGTIFPVRFDASGFFSLDVPLISGPNPISLIAFDQAGNKTSTSQIVTLNPLILNMVTLGDTISILQDNGQSFSLSPQATLAYLKLGLGEKAKDKTVIRRFQQRLKDLGYFLGEINGLFGNQTRQAVASLQKNFKLASQTGQVDLRTLFLVITNDLHNSDYSTALSDSSTGHSAQALEDAANFTLDKNIAPNKKDEQIKFLQKKLYLLGYYRGPIHGWLNSSTHYAISTFRKLVGLQPGGYDQSTRDAINKL